MLLKSRSDVTEDGVDLATEQSQRGNRDNRDKGYDESILGQALSSLISPKLCHCIYLRGIQIDKNESVMMVGNTDLWNLFEIYVKF
jgi:hypothetical protein